MTNGYNAQKLFTSDPKLEYNGACTAAHGAPMVSYLAAVETPYNAVKAPYSPGACRYFIFIFQQ